MMTTSMTTSPSNKQSNPDPDKSGRVGADATITLRMTPGGVEIKARTYLGGERFGAYRNAIAGARFVPATKSNVAPLDKVPAILRRLHEADFTTSVCDALLAALRKGEAEGDALVEAAEGRIERVEARLAERGLHLFPFQREGVRWLARRTGALLADEMGLGKTITTLVALPEGAPVIVVAPAVAKGVWAREAAAWRPDLRVTVLSGRGSFRWPGKGEMVVLNFDILPAEAELLAAGPAPSGCALVGDEAHALKSHKAQRTARFRAIGEACRAARGRTWVLTATPLLNRPPELWGVLSAAGLEREVFGTWGGFVAAFDGVKDPKWGGMRWGQPREDVPDLLARASVRRTRAQVLPELPTKTWESLEVDVKAGALRACDKLVAKLAKEGVDLDQVEAAVLRDKLQFQDFSEVRAALATAKIPAMIEIVEHHEEQGEPLVVFSAHRAPIDVLEGREGWAVITGDTSADERSRIEESFQRSGDPAYVGTRLRGVAATIQAGGVAITLTRAARMLFVDRHWTPALNAQAEDRCCRIGQTRGVLITTLVAPHALDRRLARILTVKTALAAGALALTSTPVEEEGVDLDALAVEVTQEIEAQDRHAAERRAAGAKDRSATRRIERRLGNGAGEGSDVEVEEEPRPARGPVEEWVAEAILTLTGMDDDRAVVQNGVGWNKADGGLGHAMAHRIESGVGLTASHWEAARKIVRKYHGQVGCEPSDAGSDS